MHIITTIAELRQWRETVNSVAFVPTMGNLHEGHLSLVERAKTEAEHTVVSIFVNRIQFGENEDFDRYPRTLQQDAERLRQAGVSVLFAPNETELYPHGAQQYFVEPPSIQHDLCGAFRPHHFRGVATVVAKLFNIVQPNIACFGTKDFQQFAIIRAMVDELNMNVRIIGVPTARAPDGLALSSRNQYLSPKEREQATLLYRELSHISQQIIEGNQDFKSLTAHAIQHLQQEHWRVDYIAVRDANTLQEPNDKTENVVILAAAHLGSTRLIDNIETPLPRFLQAA